MAAAPAPVVAAASKVSTPAMGSLGGKKGETYRDTKIKADVRTSNMEAAKAVADAVRTSLGPRGMDKMVAAPNGEVIITNDGATILKKMNLEHPAAKMLVDLSHSQDVVAGDGTTSVVVLCGSILKKCLELIQRGVHPTVISDAMNAAANKAQEILENELGIPVDLTDRNALIAAATTSLGSKVVSQHASLLAPIAVDSVLKVSDHMKSHCDLRDIRVITKVGGTIDDTEMVDGLVFTQKVSKTANGLSRVENAKIALIQFCVSPPKTDLENNVIVSDYAAMDRILKEERNYILGLVKKIKASGCNVLLIQKSILRDATTELSLHYLAKAKILVIKDVERDEIEFVSKTLNCRPVAHVDQLTPDKLGHAKLVAETTLGGGGSVTKITGIENMGSTATVLVRGSNKLVADEAERSLHDALCVIRCLVQKRFLLAGGGAPEIEISQRLRQWSSELLGMQSYCVKAYAEALEVVPYTLAENAGLHPIQIVTELRAMHAKGMKTAGINVRKGTITDILEEKVLQPLLVTSSAIGLATETVRMVLKIDDRIMVA